MWIVMLLALARCHSFVRSFTRATSRSRLEVMDGAFGFPESAKLLFPQRHSLETTQIVLWMPSSGAAANESVKPLRRAARQIKHDQQEYF
jgi:hypothetical protein